MISETIDLISTDKRVRTEKFCVNVADALHAIAQPLTVLQVRLDPAVAEEMDAVELRTLVAESSQQVERLCNLFGFMQGFIVAQVTEPDLSEQDVGLILDHVAEGMSLFYHEGGKSLRLRLPDKRQVVLVDRTRMYQALSRILLVAFEVSLANDIVELTASLTGNEVSIVIRNLETYRALGKESALKLALAEANIERQGGSLTWTAEPFRVEIALRAVRSFHLNGDGLRA
jgi:hypothetical protein